MVSTTEILPCPALQPYIRCYTLREFSTNGSLFLKPLPANHELVLSFILSGNFFSADTNSTDVVGGARRHLVGLQPESRGALIFEGDIKFFTIQFQPNGFYRLFGIPGDALTGNIYNLADITIKGINEYNERLNEAKNLYEMKGISDKVFVAHLSGNKTDDRHNSITNTSSLILTHKGNVNIKSLATHSNMSLRSFETKFSKQVGVSPKLFSRITRFNHALILRMKDTSKSWTDICHQCGYFDQMHFIKEFKQFAGDSPVNFYKNTPMPFEDFREG